MKPHEEWLFKAGQDLESSKVLLQVVNPLFDDCIYLNPFSTLYRYPEGDLMPMKEEVENALESALRIREFVSDKLK